MTYDEIIAQFAAQGKFNPFQYNTETMARDLGFNGTARTQPGWGGSPSESTGQGTEAMYDLTPDFEQFLKGYSYEPATSGGRNAALDIRNQSGQMVQDDYRVGDHKGSMMKFMGAAVPLAVGAGFGVGGLDALGLMGGAPASASGSFNAALGNSLADMSLMNTGAAAAEAGTVGGGLSLGGATSGAGIGGNASWLGAGGAGLSSGAGLTAPMYAGGGGLGMTAGAAAGAAAGGIPWGDIAKSAAGPLLSSGVQMYGANKAAGAMGDATNQANELQRHVYDTTRADNMPALTARNSALEQMQALLKDPSSLTTQPGYQFGMDQGTKSLNSGAAARGQTYSGGQAKALTRYGQDYAGTKLDQSFNRLATLAQGGQPGASQTVSNVTDQGNANAMPWIVGSNAVADGINGLTAYGQRKQWWGG